MRPSCRDAATRRARRRSSGRYKTGPMRRAGLISAGHFILSKHRVFRSPLAFCAPVRKMLVMPLAWNEIRQRAITFSRDWSDASRERSEAQPFWDEFL